MSGLQHFLNVLETLMIQFISGLNPAQQNQYLKAVRSGPGFLGFKTNQGEFFEEYFTDDAHALSLIDK
ncbi:hypothetical protein JZU68_10250, partial [bacterium]|nr:hypothetical protein [bacterium]